MGFYFSYDAVKLHKTISANLEEQLLDKLYSESELHCTMLYSNQSYKPEYSSMQFPDTIATIEKMTIWETPNGFVLVARLNDQVLKEYNKIIKDKFNLTDSNFTFKPHVTLQKEINKEDLINIDKLNFLIGHKVVLENFRCLMVKQKLKLKV